MIKMLNYFAGLTLYKIAYMLLNNVPALHYKYGFIGNKIIQSLPKKLENQNYLFSALIVIEDKRFHSHRGGLATEI
jgi:hypothetical protein